MLIIYYFMIYKEIYMSEQSHIIHSYAFDGKGSGRSLSESEISKELKDKNLAWLHLDATDERTQGWLENSVDYLDKTILGALLAEEARPRLEEYDDGSLLILRGVNLNPDSDPEDMVSIRLWIDRNRIISVRRRKLKAVQDIVGKIKSGNGPKNAGDFITMLATRLIDRMEPIINALDETTDKIEEQIIESPDKTLRSEIIQTRKQAILLRRHILPQKEVIGRLRILEQKWLDKNHKRQLQENYDRITRFAEELDSIRERTQVIQDELQNIMADKMNRNMYILSIVAAIFLPLGFLTGLLGINVGGIPGADEPTAFAIFCIILAALIVVQILLFKKMKLF